MRGARALWRLVSTVLHGVHGVLVVLLLFPGLSAAGRRLRIAWWAGKTLRLLGLRLEVEGAFRPGAKLLVANHVSWLDIMAIHAVCPEARFVSKADVQHWPLVNRLVAGAGTLYIERERRRDAVRVVHQMAEALKAGDTVGVFPEGTTGDGRSLLPFHANLLQAAIATETPLQPVALRYHQPGQSPSTVVAWVGDTTLAQSLWAIACAEHLAVTVTALPPVASAHADRRALAAHLHLLLDQALEGHQA